MAKKSTKEEVKKLTTEELEHTSEFKFYLSKHCRKPWKY